MIEKQFLDLYLEDKVSFNGRGEFTRPPILYHYMSKDPKSEEGMPEENHLKRIRNKVRRRGNVNNGLKLCT